MLLYEMRPSLPAQHAGLLHDQFRERPNKEINQQCKLQLGTQSFFSNDATLCHELDVVLVGIGIDPRVSLLGGEIVRPLHQCKIQLLGTTLHT